MLSLKDSTEGLDNMENLGREVAQLRERLGELDRALMAISSMVSANMKDGQEEDEDPDTGPLDHEEMKRLKSALSRVQQENERLLGTAAQISHEMEVNKEHIKVSYLGFGAVLVCRIGRGPGVGAYGPGAHSRCGSGVWPRVGVDLRYKSVAQISGSVIKSKQTCNFITTAKKKYVKTFSH